MNLHNFRAPALLLLLAACTPAPDQYWHKTSHPQLAQLIAKHKVDNCEQMEWHNQSDKNTSHEFIVRCKSEGRPWVEYLAYPVWDEVKLRGEVKVETARPKTNEIILTDEMRRDVTAAIQAAGYNCPEAKLAWAKGQDAYGAVTQVYCGPRGQSGVYENVVFRVTFTPNNRILISPWK